MKKLKPQEITAFMVRAESEIDGSGDMSFSYIGLNITVFLEKGKARKIKCSDANGCTEYYNLK